MEVALQSHTERGVEAHQRLLPRLFVGDSDTDEAELRGLRLAGTAHRVRHEAGCVVGQQSRFFETGDVGAVGLQHLVVGSKDEIGVLRQHGDRARISRVQVRSGIKPIRRRSTRDIAWYGLVPVRFRLRVEENTVEIERIVLLEAKRRTDTETMLASGIRRVDVRRRVSAATCYRCTALIASGVIAAVFIEIRFRVRVCARDVGVVAIAVARRFVVASMAGATVGGLVHGLSLDTVQKLPEGDDIVDRQILADAKHRRHDDDHHGQQNHSIFLPANSMEFSVVASDLGEAQAILDDQAHEGSHQHSQKSGEEHEVPSWFQP